MAKVWFQNSRNEKRVIAQVNDWKGAFRAINKFLDEHNYKSYYMRTWEEKGHTVIDVGSWSEFFLVDLPEKEIVYDN